MTADERALLAAVCADPDSDLPRLVYADWLDDHGRPERAEFIRLQCEVARLRGKGADKVRLKKCQGRLLALSRAHTNAWLAELPEHPRVFWKGHDRPFDRGFVVTASVSVWADSPKPAVDLATVLVAAPFDRLVVWFDRADQLPAVCEALATGTVREVEFGTAAAPDVSGDWFSTVVELDWPPRVVQVDLRAPRQHQRFLAAAADGPIRTAGPVLCVQREYCPPESERRLRRRLGRRLKVTS